MTAIDKKKSGTSTLHNDHWSYGKKSQNMEQVTNNTAIISNPLKLITMTPFRNTQWIILHTKYHSQQFFTRF